MLILNQRTLATPRSATDSVALNAYDERKRSRLKVRLASGLEAGIFLERGDHLHGGDKLLAEKGSAVVEILAAPEKLIEAVADSPLLFARAAYHLGNRHVPVQILPTDNGGKLRFQTDHVLAEMVKGLGCVVSEDRSAVPAGIRRLRRWPSPAWRCGHHHQPMCRKICTTPVTARTAPCRKSTKFKTALISSFACNSPAFCNWPARRCRSAPTPIRRAWSGRSKSA